MSLETWKREYMRVPNSRVHRYGWARVLREMLYRLDGLRQKNLKRHKVSIDREYLRVVDDESEDYVDLDLGVVEPPCHKAQDEVDPGNDYCSACPILAANDGYRECEHPEKRQWTRLEKGNPQPMITLFRKALRMVESGEWKPHSQKALDDD